MGCSQKSLQLDYGMEASVGWGCGFELRNMLLLTKLCAISGPVCDDGCTQQFRFSTLTPINSELLVKFCLHDCL